jgi:hypothetical protein
MHGTRLGLASFRGSPVWKALNEAVNEADFGVEGQFLLDEEHPELAPSAAADCGAFRVVSAVAVRAAMRSRRRVTASFGWSKLMKDKAMMKCGYSSWGGCATSVRNQL